MRTGSFRFIRRSHILVTNTRWCLLPQCRKVSARPSPTFTKAKLENCLDQYLHAFAAVLKGHFLKVQAKKISMRPLFCQVDGCPELAMVEFRMTMSKNIAENRINPILFCVIAACPHQALS